MTQMILKIVPVVVDAFISNRIVYRWLLQAMNFKQVYIHTLKHYKTRQGARRAAQIWAKEHNINICKVLDVSLKDVSLKSGQRNTISTSVWRDKL